MLVITLRPHAARWPIRPEMRNILYPEAPLHNTFLCQGAVENSLRQDDPSAEAILRFGFCPATTCEPDTFASN